MIFVPQDEIVEYSTVRVPLEVIGGGVINGSCTEIKVLGRTYHVLENKNGSTLVIDMETGDIDRMEFE